MGPLSAYEVEQICESAYYYAVHRFDYHSDANFCALFKIRVDRDFTDFADPKLHWAPEDLRYIYEKWRDKLAIDAKQWYEENVEGERERERAEAEAKRKAQNEVNRKKLAEMQEQWRAQQNPQDATVADDKVACPQCGNSVSKTSKFCTSCGTRLLVVCPNCGANVKATSKFCTSCGTPIQPK